jgi:uncharacterized cupin superfamily protein
MIVRRGQPIVEKRDEPDFGVMETARYSDFGGLEQYGAYVQTLHPGARSSTRHWHEREDEFLYVLSGEVTIVENDGVHTLGPGDAACWPAGVANAHHVLNRSEAPCAYLLVGTRPTHDVCHYPDVGKTLYTEGDTWRVEDASGQVLESGRVEPEL